MRKRVVGGRGGGRGVEGVVGKKEGGRGIGVGGCEGERGEVWRRGGWIGGRR